MSVTLKQTIDGAPSFNVYSDGRFIGNYFEFPDSSSVMLKEEVSEAVQSEIIKAVEARTSKPPTQVLNPPPKPPDEE